MLDPLATAWAREPLPLRGPRGSWSPPQRTGELSLLSSLAHEIRAPLGVVMASAAQLAGDSVALSPPEIQRAALTLQRSAVWLHGLIENALCAARIPDGKLVLRKQRCDLLDIVYDARQLLDPLLVRNGRRFCVTARQTVPAVLADRRRVGQALVNLITNADKFSERERPIDVALTARDGYVRICVADRGPGIRPEDSQRLFEPYYRGAAEAPGSGLGLAIVKAIVEAHAGRVGAENRPGGGARFWFELPVVARAGQPDGSPSPVEA